MYKCIDKTLCDCVTPGDLPLYRSAFYGPLNNSISIRKKEKNIHTTFSSYQWHLLLILSIAVVGGDGVRLHFIILCLNINIYFYNKYFLFFGLFWFRFVSFEWKRKLTAFWCGAHISMAYLKYFRFFGINKLRMRWQITLSHTRTSLNVSLVFHVIAKHDA